VVKGRYEHVSFIVNPAPLRLVVQEVLPPEPAKLLDQVRRLLAVAEDLPPILPVADAVTFADLAAAHRRSGTCCLRRLGRRRRRCGHRLPRPAAAARAVDAARLRPVPGHPRMVLRRPRRRRRDVPRARPHDPGTAVLTKCCLLEDRIDATDGAVVVPWGASLGQVGEALREIAARWEPEWRPV
jgi:hypothetical protein